MLPQFKCHVKAGYSTTDGVNSSCRLLNVLCFMFRGFFFRLLWLGHERAVSEACAGRVGVALTDAHSNGTDAWALQAARERAVT